MNSQIEKRPDIPPKQTLGDVLKKIWLSFRRNFWWKIAAIILGILLWAGLISQDASLVREKVFTDVTVSVTGTDTLQRYGYIVVSDLTNNPITVRMKAEVPQLEYDNATSSAYNPRIDLSRISSAGTQTVKITTTSSSTYGSVIEILPDTVELEVEEYVTRYRIPVSIVQSGEYPDGYYASALTMDPARVTIKGPKSKVEKISKVLVEFDCSQVVAREGKNSISLSYKLVDENEEEITSNLIEVTSEPVLLDSIVIEYTLYPTQLITLSGLGMTTGSPPEGYEVKKITVEPNVIRIAATAENLELLSLDSLFLDQAVSLTDKTESFVEVVKVRKPTEVVDLTPDSVTVAVEIGPIITQNIYSGLKINLENLTSGYSAQVDVSKADILITGAELWLDKLKSSAIKLYVDLSGLTEGVYDLSVNVDITNSNDISYTYQIIPDTVQVQITAK